MVKMYSEKRPGNWISALAVPGFAQEGLENTVNGDDAFVIRGWNDDIRRIVDDQIKEMYFEECTQAIV